MVWSGLALVWLWFGFGLLWSGLGWLWVALDLAWGCFGLVWVGFGLVLGWLWVASGLDWVGFGLRLGLASLANATTQLSIVFPNGVNIDIGLHIVFKSYVTLTIRACVGIGFNTVANKNMCVNCVVNSGNVMRHLDILGTMLDTFEGKIGRASCRERV